MTNRLEDFNVQDLVNTTWAFAKLGQYDTSLFAAWGVNQGANWTIWTLNIANLAWRFKSRLPTRNLSVWRGRGRVWRKISTRRTWPTWRDVANAGHLDATLPSPVSKTSNVSTTSTTTSSITWRSLKARQNKVAERLKQKEEGSEGRSRRSRDARMWTVQLRPHSGCRRYRRGCGGCSASTWVSTGRWRRMRASTRGNTGLTVQGQDDKTGDQPRAGRRALHVVNIISRPRTRAGDPRRAFGVKSKENASTRIPGGSFTFRGKCLPRILDAIRPGTIGEQ